MMAAEPYASPDPWPEVAANVVGLVAAWISTSEVGPEPYIGLFRDAVSTPDRCGQAVEVLVHMVAAQIEYDAARQGVDALALLRALAADTAARWPHPDRKAT